MNKTIRKLVLTGLLSLKVFNYPVRTNAKDVMVYNSTFNDMNLLNFKALESVDSYISSNFNAIVTYCAGFCIACAAATYIVLKVKAMRKTIKRKNNQLGVEMKEKNDLLLKVLKLEQSKNDYLINLSHELRTPLNVISLTNQLVLKLNEENNLTKKDLEKYIEMSNKNVDRLLKLINDLMDSSKIDSGKFKLFIEEDNIINVIEDSVMSLKHLVEEKGIELVFDTEVEECFMKFDPTAIDRCIVNVVNNAAKFTNAGGQIFIYIADEEKEIKVTISDTGCGIEKEYLENIFDRFNQAHNSKTEAKIGSGLGLTITKRLINLHGGEIYVESEVNKGSTFTIILPKAL